VIGTVAGRQSFGTCEQGHVDVNIKMEVEQDISKGSRKPHKKSRLGCGNCKRRRIKVGWNQSLADVLKRAAQGSVGTARSLMQIEP